jgi:hypothetical protein
VFSAVGDKNMLLLYPFIVGLFVIMVTFLNLLRSKKQEILLDDKLGERELSHVEKFMYSLKEMAPQCFNICIGLSLRDPIDKDVLRKAVDMLQEKFLLLRSHVVELPGKKLVIKVRYA